MQLLMQKDVSKALKDLDIENNYATNVSVDNKLAIEAKARFDYDEYLYNLHNQDRNDLDELKDNAVRRTGDTMSRWIEDCQCQ